MMFQHFTWPILAVTVIVLYSGCTVESTQFKPPPVAASEVDAHPEVTLHELASLNSAADDFGATVSFDQYTLIFTSAREPSPGRQALFMATADGASWTPATPLAALNLADKQGTSSLTGDGQTMYFACVDRMGGSGDADIYYSQGGGGTWSEPKPVLGINTPGWESQPSVTPDGNTLYFVSNRAGGFGGKDIWVTTRGEDMRWSTPQNLGPMINTPFDEASPSIAVDGTTLYFASNGHPSIGGYDIFVSYKSGTEWTLAHNLGTPVNSPANELFYTAPFGKTRAMFTSDRYGGTGGLDLYEVRPTVAPPKPVNVVHGMIYDGPTRTPIGATLTIAELLTGNRVATVRSDNVTGAYNVVLPPGESFTITAVAPKHLFYTFRVDVPAHLDSDMRITQDFTLPTYSGSVGLLMYYPYNKAQLDKESTAELKQLLSFLTQNPNIRIELSGHTDSVGTKGYNAKLSLDRAEAVKSWLVERGIVPDRIEARGYGMDQPLVSNETNEGRASNRRVEFRLLGM